MHTQELCAKKSDGTEVCASGDPLAAILAGTAAGAPSSSGAPAVPEPAADAGTVGDTTSTTSASLSVNGNTPVYWNLNAPWQDNLGVLFSRDGIAETIYSTSTVDTTQPGTTTIDYWAVVPATQQWLHTTRDIVVQGAANDNPQPQGAEQSSHDDNAPAASSTPRAANDNPPPAVLSATGTDGAATTEPTTEASSTAH